MRNRHRRLRHGFGLLTTLVAVVVVALIGMMLVSNLRGYEREAQLMEDATDLLALETALTAVVGAASRYPLQLSHTASPPTTSDKNSCGEVWQAGWTSNWTAKSPFGPFYRKRVIPIGTGFPLFIGLAKDTMIRGTTNLTIVIPTVQELDAIDLDLIIDGTTNNRTAGKVQWKAASGGVTDTLYFVHTRTSGNC